MLNNSIKKEKRIKYDKDLLIIRIIQGIVTFSVLYIFTFYVLKKIGVINTPLLLELSPYILAVISILTILFGFSQFILQLKNLPDSHLKLVKSHLELTKRVDRIGIGLTRVEKDVDFIKNDMTRFERRIDSFETRVDKRFDEVDRRFDEFERSVDRKFNKIDINFNNVEKKLDKVFRYKTFLSTASG